MAQKYTIYINDNTLLITDDFNSQLDGFQVLDYKNFDFSAFYHQVDKTKSEKFVIKSTQVTLVFRQIKKSVRFIHAAGGLVSNGVGDLLFIHRLGKWDLPKGKVEEGEKISLAARREVAEECGVRVKSKIKLITKTYHVYEMKGQLILKQTTWYEMHVVGVPALTPQTEEGISAVIWVNPSDIEQQATHTYPSILDVLRAVNLS